MADLRVRSIVVAVTLISGCVEPEPDADLGEASSAISSDQGSDYQGSDYQGSDYQGSDYQGSDYQGSDYQGATLGGVALASGTSLYQDRALSVWRVLRTFPARHEQRFPDRTCLWDSTRTQLQGCTSVALSATTVSPLAGVAFPASFTRDGVTFKGSVRVANRAGSVLPDTTYAMHPMSGASAIRWPGQVMPTMCSFAANGQQGCENPQGCRQNCDLFTYQLEVVDSDGGASPFCPGGQYAYAVPGKYEDNGQWTASTAQFTFVCAGGTIAKCTRWGYRPFGSAQRTDGVSTPLADYHQACVRAATADYCSNGHSFTKNGTLVDIWDYDPALSGVAGLVPRTKSLVGWSATGLRIESTYDRYGAREIENLRYEELTGTLGTLDDVDVGCPGRFHNAAGDDAGLIWDRQVIDEPWVNPVVSLDSSTVCAHSEKTRGKWLHTECTDCTKAVATGAYTYCSDPHDPRGWDGACVARANAVCIGAVTPMTSHSECTTGARLDKYATGCTARVCRDHPACCTSAGSWTSACTAAAATCPGYTSSGLGYGFCGATALPPGL